MWWRIVDDGMGAFIGANDDETQFQDLLQSLGTVHAASPSRSGLYYACWIDVLRLMDAGVRLPDTDRQVLKQFIAWRRELLEEKAGELPMDWLEPPWKLYPHQHLGVAHFLKRKAMLLADDMGTGKSLTTIAAFMIYRRHIRPDARLVLFADSGHRMQWAKEFSKFTREDALSTKDIGVVMGTAADRRRVLAAKRPITILHYPCLWLDTKIHRTGITGPLMDAVQGASMIAWDEMSAKGTGLRNLSSKASKIARAVSKDIPYRLGITGTPVERLVTDFHSLYMILDPRVVGPRLSFENAYIEWEERPIWVYRNVQGKKKERVRIWTRNAVGTKNLGHLRERIRHAYIRRTLQEVGKNLPEIIPVPIWIELSPAARKIYRTLKSRVQNTSDEAEKKNQAIRLRQFCCDPRLLDESADIPAAKTERILEIVEDDFSDDSILIFTSFRRHALLIKEALGTQAGLVVGGVSLKKRDGLQRAFNNGDVRILVGDEAMERGLNLQERTSVVLNADIGFLPTSLSQRVGRARRIGSGASSIRVVTVLVRDTYEERMLETVAKRMRVFEEIFTQGQDSPFEGLTIRELEALL